MDILRSKTPEMVRKEIYAYFLAYNLLRSLMWEAGNAYGVPPLRLSLQGTRNHFNNFIKDLSKASNTKIPKIYCSLLKIIIHKLVPSRPGRVEPRKVKRRPKAFPYMQEPRKLARKKLMTV
ncbi:transposase [Calothrix sp. NIES-4071]|nr:transposase [Calothrix sp. NIES-4071]BAZ61042.1 transposase [Calothrix sp. NIES-4105]